MVIVFPIALVAVCLFGIRLRSDDYMSREQTTDIKGIFAYIILLSHASSYIHLSNQGGDRLFSAFLSMFGQLMVVLFFFYSGYGVLESYKGKANYSKSFFRNRLLKTLVHFDCAVFLYLILSFVLSVKYSPRQYILCWIGWEDIGNSNWFIFVILMTYLVSQFSFILAKVFFREDRKILAVVVFTCLLSGLCFIALYASSKENYWYNTLMCYPLGVVYSFLKDKIDVFLGKVWRYCMALLGVFAVFLLTYFQDSSVLYNICSCCFCLIVVMLTMKIRVGNAVLNWLGRYSFSIYILQRIPMIILSSLGLSNAFLFVSLSLLLTIAISIPFQKFTSLLDKVLFR